MTNRPERKPRLLHVQATPLGLSAERPEVPQDLARIVGRCLEKEPRRRPTSLQLVRVLGSDEQKSPTETSAENDEGATPAARRLWVHALLPLILLLTAVAPWQLMAWVAAACWRPAR